MNVNYNLVVDFARPSKTNNVLVSENDAGTRVCHFTLLADKQPLDMKEVLAATLSGIINGKEIITDSISLVTDEDGNVVNELYYTIPSGLTEIAGTMVCTITLLGEENRALTSFEFYLKIRNALYNEDDYVSDDELAGFRQLLQKTQTALAKLEQAVSNDSLPNKTPLLINNLDGHPQYDYIGKDGGTVEINFGGYISYFDEDEIIDIEDPTPDESAEANAVDAANRAIAARDEVLEAKTDFDENMGEAQKNLEEARGYYENIDALVPRATVIRDEETDEITIILSDINGTTSESFYPGSGSGGASSWAALSGKPFKTLGEDFKVVDDELNISDEILNRFDADAIGVALGSKEYTLTDSADGNIVGLHMYGESHKSKNLLNATTTNGTLQGINYVHNDDGTYTFSGTTTSNTNIGLIEKLPLDTLPSRISFGGKPNNSNIYSIWLNVFEGTTYLKSYHAINGYSTKLKPEILNECPTANMYQIGVYIQSGISVNNEVIKPMVVNADLYPDVTYSDYEPYGLIIADKIESQNKNLFYDRLDNYAVYGDSTYGYKVDISTNAISYVAKIEPNKIYTISKKLGVGNRFRCATFPDENFISQNSIDGAIEITATGYTSNEKTFTNGSNKYLVLTVTTEKITEEPMAQIEVGDVATEYVECKSSAISIKDVFGSDFTLASVGDIRNELIVNADGSGEYIKRVEKVDLGTLTYAYSSTYSVFSTDMLESTAKTGTNNIICDKYNNENSTNPVASLSDYSISFNTANTLRIKDTSYTDVSVFKTAVNGVYLVYELESPTVTKLSVSEVKALLSLKTFRDYTLINADCEADIEYYKNNKIGQAISNVGTKLENEIEELESAISGKANASTTLNGYGITNAYTKTEIDSKIGNVEALLAAL